MSLFLLPADREGIQRTPHRPVDDQQAIPIHAGMGMTDEMAVGHYFKRVTALDLLLGTADQHLQEKSQVASRT